MSDRLKLHLKQLSQAASIDCLGQIAHGIEKESLRVDQHGHIAQTPHPEGAGSPLTHPSITTDFSEALVEFISPVFQDVHKSLRFLEDQHSFFYSQLKEGEYLWTSSMPCILEEDAQIPLANYGHSNIGRLKTLYREGLGYRYGRSMQVISGIHYNFSLPETFWSLYSKQLNTPLSLKDFKTEQYFNLIRNFRRYSWLLIYLFGASPAVCKSFLKNNNQHGLENYDDGTFYAPYGTSLRMGDLGYTSEAQAGLYISYNNLNEYSEGLISAIKTTYPAYEKFARVNGTHKQLNSSILQIENEFYSTIRPKRVAPSGTRPVQILAEQGVEYIEVRCLDLNPFLTVGIDEAQINFLNTFLLFCLLRNSPLSCREEYHQIDQNLRSVVMSGRNPDLLLKNQGENILLRNWATEILNETGEIAKFMDEITGQPCHTEATNLQLMKVEDSSLTPSAKVLERMDELKTPYFHFAMNQSLANSDYFRARSLSTEAMSHNQATAEKSNQARKEIEDNDQTDFDTFLKKSNEI